ncbi:MAG: class I SAM-dependent methyltransferase [Gammaproteobacteria bacterium]|nr:class I SAM-dependent methyltransferase [Gammaproteobacteria bacterium]
MKPEKTIQQLYKKHRGKRSTKWSNYLPEYDRLFSAYKDNAITLLEIGVRKGGSLEIWANYFSQAQHLIGCEIDRERANLTFDDPRIVLIIGDANDDETKKAIVSHSRNVDIVIDDGSHTSSDIIQSFANFFPHLNDGGIYVVEDLHCSYSPDFDGGLDNPLSSIAFFKALIDVIHKEHWNLECKTGAILEKFFTAYNCRMDEKILQHIHSVEFINSLCIIRKMAPKNNQLGTKIAAGKDSQKKRLWPAK